MKHKPIDATGKRIRVEDTVRVVGVSDLSGMAAKYRRESLPIFKYLVGKYKKVEEFDRFGCAWLMFTIRKGKNRGMHSVAMEPFLLRVRRPNSSKRHLTSRSRPKR